MNCKTTVAYDWWLRVGVENRDILRKKYSLTINTTSLQYLEVYEKEQIK